MLGERVLIYQLASAGGSDFTCKLYFETPKKAKYLNIGDQVTDSAGNVFNIANTQLPFINGREVTLSPMIPGSTPVEENAYTCTISTPGKKKDYSEINTKGQILTCEVSNPSIYEFIITSQWQSSENIRDAALGDLVVDGFGNSYRITEISNRTFNSVTFKVVDDNHKAIEPKKGEALLIRPTEKLKLLVGSFQNLQTLTDIATRNAYLIDQYLASNTTGSSGGSSGGGGGAAETYEHSQSTPSSMWMIQHNLGRYPSVTVVDSGGTVVEGDIQYIDQNNLKVTFSAPFGGKAFLN